MSSWLNVVGLCQISIEYFIFVPILLYFCSELKQIPLDSEALKHRNRELVYFMNLLSILSLTIEIPFDIITHVFHNDSLRRIPTNFFMWALFLLFTVKSWLLFFNLQYHFSLLKLQWKIEINPRYRSWFILNRNTYGNLRYCLRIIILPFLLYMITVSLLQYIFATDLFIYSSLILCCLVIIPSAILYRRLQTIEDLFNIRKELFHQQTIICVSITVMICVQLIIAVVFRVMLSKHTRQMIVKLINAFIASIAVFLISLTSSWYPSTTHKHHITASNVRWSAARGSEQARLSVDAMLTCVADRKGFSAFMRHLVQEFATENMLFLCEYIQIKYELQKKYKGIIKIKKQQHFGGDQNNNINANDDYVTIDFNIPNAATLTKAPSIVQKIKSQSFDPFGRMESTSVRRGKGVYSYLFMSNGAVWNMIRLPARLPKAEILNEKHSFIDRINGLFEKYIRTESVHEINIPYPQRQAITDLLERIMESEYKENDEYDEIECNMCNVLDELCIEIIHLMADSYRRFATSVGHKLSVIKHINNSTIEPQSGNQREDGDNNNDNETEIAPNVQVIRNGGSYDELRTEYNVEDIEIWPFNI